MSETKFQAGDRCVAFGLDCVVDSMGNIGDVYCVRVKFPDHIHMSLTVEGLLYLWHKEPSLKLIERPKKKVTNTMYQAAYRRESGIVTMSLRVFENEREAKNVYGESFIALGPAITFEVEE